MAIEQVVEKLKSPPEPVFPLGSAVRVKNGSKDPDFPDMPLGGWAGVVKEVEAKEIGAVYLVEWNSHTLRHIHPVYRRRCERDGLELTSSWLGEEDLETDSGEPAALEQPTDLQPRPLDATNLEDRIRAVFQLTTDDPLPQINDATLGQYHQHLNAQLVLPLEVDHVGQNFVPGKPTPMTLRELLLPKQGAAKIGLLSVVKHGDQRVEIPLSEFEARPNGAAKQLLADYAYWFCNNRPDVNQSLEPQLPEEEEAPPTVRRTVLNAISRCGLYGAACGAAVGAITATMDGVLFAMGVGAITLGLVGYVAGTRYGFFFGKVSRIDSGPILGGIFGLVAGAVAGAVAGPFVVAYMGAIFGSIAGAIAGQILRLINRRLPGPVLAGLIGAGLGVIFEAWSADQSEALTGLLYGTVVGAVAGMLLALGFFGSLILVEMRRNDSED